MKKLGMRGRKGLKIVHLILAGLWLGGAVTLNLMVLALGPAETGPELYGYDLARRFVDDFVIVPAAMGCLVSGFLISWLTPWGFFRHRWVTVKWALTVACILIGVIVLGPPVNEQAGISETLGLLAPDNAEYAANRLSTLLGGLALILAILFMLVISVLKPWQKNK
ncbi:MAG: hypothetical protein LBQ63_03770 [Deltaproteobacteria bacterium]|jgi:hypothetical protein|nr:hypothetical protein [Deltaproteobacteria bacterium]